MSDKSALDAARMILRADDDGDEGLYGVLACVWAESMALALLAMAEENERMRDVLDHAFEALHAGRSLTYERAGESIGTRIRAVLKEPSNG